HGDCGSKRASFRLDPRALVDQRVDDARELLRRNPQQLPRLEVAPRVPKPELVEPIDSGLLGDRIAADEPTVGGVVCGRACRPFDYGAAVVELYRRAEILPQGVRV